MTLVSIDVGPIPHSSSEHYVQGRTYRKEETVFKDADGCTYKSTVDDNTTEPFYVFNSNTGEYVTPEGWDLVAIGAGNNTVQTLAQVAADVAGLKSGRIPAALAANLLPWSEQANIKLTDMWAGTVRFTGGEASVLTSEGGRILSLVARSDFYASALRSTGFNLLRNAVALTDGCYILVPAMSFGAYGSAVKPNGILFTDSEGNNLHPTVRFKALGSGVPENISDGSLCTYTETNGLYFFTTPSAGYLIISDITLASSCAHVGWSRRYDEYVAPDATGDAGGSVALSSIIHAIHAYDLMLAVGQSADRIDFGDTKATWSRKCDRIQPSWTTTAGEEGAYIHTATISGMKADGAVRCGSLNLEVNGTKVSYTDNSETATEEYVYYELATVVTGQVTISPDYALEDWGLEYLEGATGSAYITTRYSQGLLDTMTMLMSGGLEERDEVVAAILNSQNSRIAAIERMIKEGFAALKVENLTVLSKFTNEGEDDHYEGAGDPAIISSRVGRRYKNTTSGEWWTATGNKTASQWKKDTNAS